MKFLPSPKLHFSTRVFSHASLNQIFALKIIQFSHFWGLLDMYLWNINDSEAAQKSTPYIDRGVNHSSIPVSMWPRTYYRNPIERRWKKWIIIRRSSVSLTKLEVKNCQSLLKQTASSNLFNGTYSNKFAIFQFPFNKRRAVECF